MGLRLPNQLQVSASSRGNGSRDSAPEHPHIIVSFSLAQKTLQNTLGLTTALGILFGLASILQVNLTLRHPLILHEYKSDDDL
jgi:hypothetical protein